MYLYIVLGGYLRILGAPSGQFCFTLLISASFRVFVYGIYRKSRLVCVLSDLYLSRHHPFKEKERQPSIRFAWPTCKSDPIAGDGRFRHSFSSPSPYHFSYPIVDMAAYYS